MEKPSDSSVKTYTVAVCLIVKNEAHNLAQCLEPIKNFADSIWITDTGSTDDTCEIAKQYTQNLFHHAWIDDFAAARNEIYERLPDTDWVMHIDADERWSPDSLKKLDIILQSLDPAEQPYVLNISFKHDEHRILKRCLHSGHFDFRFSGQVHEKLVLANCDSPEEAEETPIRLDCTQVIVQHATQSTPAKAAYYERLIQIELQQANTLRRQAELYWHLGDALLQQYKSTSEAYANALRVLTQAGWRKEWFDYIILMTTASSQLRDHQNPMRLRKHYLDVCDLFSDHPAPYYFASWTTLYGPRPRQAAPLAKRYEALKHHPDPFKPNPAGEELWRLRLMVAANEKDKALKQVNAWQYKYTGDELFNYHLFLLLINGQIESGRNMIAQAGFRPEWLNQLAKKMTTGKYLSPFEQKQLKKVLRKQNL